jgi:hypothetical protein
MANMKELLLMSALVDHVLAAFSLLGFTFNDNDIEPRSPAASGISVTPQTTHLVSEAASPGKALPSRSTLAVPAF